MASVDKLYRYRPRLKKGSVRRQRVAIVERINSRRRISLKLTGLERRSLSHFRKGLQAIISFRQNVGALCTHKNSQHNREILSSV